MIASRLMLATAGMVTLTAAVLAPAPAHAATVSLEAQLGQPVLDARKPGRLYLRIALKSLAAAKRETRAHLNVALVIDRSGSMSGDRIAAAREAATAALDRLSGDDVVSLVAYNHKVDILHPASRLAGNDQSLRRAISRLEADGTTALYAGTKEGGQQVREFLSENKVNRVILISDGLANVGPSSPSELAALGRELASKGITVTTIGLGLDYNEDLMQRLAQASDGNHAFVEHPRQLASIFDKEFGDALSVSARDVIIEIELEHGFKPRRVLGRDAEISGSRVRLSMNQLQSLNERYIVLEIETPPDLATGETGIAAIELRYLDIDTGNREKVTARVKARISDDAREAEASLDKAVMSQVTEQIATEATEKAVELRDTGDIKGARKVLEENAQFLKRERDRYASGEGAAPEAAVRTLDDLEKKSREAASNLEEENWGKARKSMRYDQHKSKNQQSY